MHATRPVVAEIGTDSSRRKNCMCTAVEANEKQMTERTNSGSTSRDDDKSCDASRCWPEDRDEGRLRRSILRTLNDALFYSYMNPILRKGSNLDRQRRRGKEAGKDGDGGASSVAPSTEGEESAPAVEELSMDDLYRAPKSMEAAHLQNEFCRLMREEQAKSPAAAAAAAGGWEKRGSARTAFMRVLWGLAKPSYVPAGFFQLVAVLSQCMIPILVRQVLRELERNPGQSFLRTGMPLAFGLWIVSTVEGLAMERQKHLAFRSGIVLRAAIVNAVYDHMLRLTPAGKSGLTSGEITNLVAIDSQKLFELTQEGHQIWSCPLAMVIVTALLLWELGPTILVGMTSMFLLVPVVQVVVQTMMHIRKKRVAETDRRIEATTAMLQGIKFTKLNHYEEKFSQRVTEARRREMKLLTKELTILALTFFLTVISPVLASALTFITYVLVGDGNVLPASTTFTTLFLFSALRFPINYAGKLMGKAAQGIQACQRFAEFFSREIQTDHGSDDDITEETDIGGDVSVLLKLENCSFTVGSPRSSPKKLVAGNEAILSKAAAFTVSNINVTVKRSEILCVVGPVASGKSTFLNGLIGDISPSFGSSMMKMKGRIAYASQTPFILNSTLRDNILFGAKYDKERYEKVLDACCLLQDLEQIGPARDLTEIGERGVTLSGGQKQRVSLARVAYSRPDIAIFDDPLSALDASTGKKVFEKLFKSTDNSLLSKSAIILVTHAAHFLHRVDQIMVLVEGRAAFVGKWEDLSTCKPTDSAAKDALYSILTAVQEDAAEDNTSSSVDSNEKAVKDSFACEATSSGDLMTIEEREFGLSDWRTWVQWYKYAGGVTFVLLCIIGLGIDRFFYVVAEWWLASWTSAVTEPIERFGHTYPPQSDGKSAQVQYITTYAIILVISFAAAMARAQWLVQGGARCSDRLLALMTARILRAPMSYFETTPLGRILTRFTYDAEVLDVTLTLNMTMLMTSSGWFFTGIILMTVILPWQLLALVFILIVYWLLLLHYRKSAVDLQRLDAVSRSPVQAQLAEILDGTSTVRAFHRQPFFSKIFRSSLDKSSASMMNFLAAQTWLRARIQLIGATAVLFSVCLVVGLNDVLNISPGLAAMLIIWSSNFTVCLGFMVQAIAESEASMTSVERVLAMLELPQESDVKTDKNATLSKNWPSSGKLQFDAVSLRYRPGLPLSLDGLTFTLESGQRCGVVGRTGAGKSTLTAALFRLVEIESGRVMLDGVDLSQIGLSDVRGRKKGMTIIPQDPVLFAGTLRECLDPFGDSTDEEVFEALMAVRVANAANRGMDALQDHVDDGGRNFSVGERQLLCLGRAILANPKVLVLDEATASVDGETDAFIQRMLRTRFKGTTLLTIAHRLHSVMDYDVILSMADGKAIEFGSPKELLQKKDGLFSSLVDATGKESSSVLHASVLVN